MPHPETILLDAPGSKFLLLGNEAIARGVLEAGIQVVTTYPGTPSSEIADTVSSIAQKAGIYMEYSTNEKVAIETAAGASISGVRSLVCMKHVGMNVAADPLMTLAYTGVRAGMVVVTADDPNAWSSQNEQDNRYYARFSKLPCLEPSNPQEAKDMVVEAIKISEELEVPVILRTTTRISHVRGPVVYGPIVKERKSGYFEKDVRRFVMVPAHARIRHIALLESYERAKELSEKSPFNEVIKEGTSKAGIICSGACVGYVMDAVSVLGCDVSVLKLGFTHPLPEAKIVEFLNKHERVLVFEELEPILETEMRAIAQKHGLKTEIRGKDVGIPSLGELNTSIAIKAIAKFVGLPVPPEIEESLKAKEEASKLIPPRPPELCPGCPHRASFYVIKKAIGGEAIVCTTDIGCYALGIRPPMQIGDLLICMGASIGTACGISEATGKPVIAVIGDSTFFHAGIPALINAIYNNHRVVVCVLDNFTTAMTGFQPHPGTGVTGMGSPAKRVLVEEVARGCGCEFVRVVDPFDVRDAISILKEALKYEGPSVIVFRHPCAILSARMKRARGEPIIPYRINEKKCTNCRVCINSTGCPAFYVKDGKVYINEVLCNGCGLCAQVCPQKAIEPVKKSKWKRR